MRNGIRIGRAVGACAVAAAALALTLTTAATAAKSGPPLTTSGNWSGYAVSGNGQSFNDVTGSWTQPHVSCRRHPSSSSSFWVGLGGFAADATGIEQIGTSADCRGGRAVYDAWYELIPSPPVRLHMEVSPGDRLIAEVSVQGTAVTLWLNDVTTGQVFGQTKPLAAPDLSSAEWIAEAPSLCASGCRALPLASFGATTFTATSATAGSHTGTITDANWSAASIQLAARRPDSASAMPSHLSVDGSSFTVTTVHERKRRRWHHRR